MERYYFDNAASSFPKAPGVGRAMARYIDEIGANVSRGSYAEAMDAGLVVLETREKLASLFHFGGDCAQCVFTPGATWGINAVLSGFLRPGDHVIVSSLEHNAVMRPLTALASRGVTFSRIPADAQGVTDPRDILPLMRHNTRLVMVSHASNVSGVIFPLAETARICRDRGIPLALDAAQTAGHIDIDFDALGLSALIAPGHKGLLGPQGIGALLMKEDFARALPPFCYGGTGSASDSELQPERLPDKFESGTMNLPGIFGLSTALDFILSRGVDSLRMESLALTERFLEGIKGLPAIIAGTADAGSRVGVVSLDFPGRDNAEVAFALERDHHIDTRCGLHCAPSAHRTLGTFPQGTVRFSFGYATTPADIDYVVDAIGKVTKG